MRFNLDMNPPTCTAQEKKVAMVHGHLMFYEPPRLKEAKAALMEHLKEFVPDHPFEGALMLRCDWRFYSKSHKCGTWRTTKPDTDNLQKMLKDCMTKCGYWKDDAQVVWETVAKHWEKEPGIEIEITELDNDNLYRV